MFTTIFLAWTGKRFHEDLFPSTASSFSAYPIARMKVLKLFVAAGVVPMSHLACAQVTGGDARSSAFRDGLTRFAEEDVSDVGMAEVHPIPPGDEEAGEDLIEQLEADGQTTGETPCPHGLRRARMGARKPLNLTTV